MFLGALNLGPPWWAEGLVRLKEIRRISARWFAGPQLCGQYVDAPPPP